LDTRYVAVSCGLFGRILVTILGRAEGLQAGEDHMSRKVPDPLDAPTNVIAPGVGAADTPAEVGVLAGAEAGNIAKPDPIADPLEAAAEIEREEEQRGEVKPVNITPEPGDVALPSE